ncbi:UV radiation resistance-associated protein [Cyphellophora attinorum]|uniref:UV radiation resistance-associated protein n=1 Tax=Cyphellophora attinorum TaxID=1664694 RepID=A0A0N1H1D9_9EURO|nr:UV radiation resistance-associated protein [Phialophora attinorum]KPI38135.1 UV radiation resistance-associated protein [Phialophora attinorum]
MSGHDSSGPAVRHERPFIFPWNRRLRHLHGVSLRNLDLTTTPSRQRGKTITDDDAPYNLDSPTKRALRGDAHKLTHSSSFTNVVEAKNHRPGSLQKAATAYSNDGRSPTARPVGRMRRRSTLHWNSATPRARQEKLRDLTAHRLIDTWFTLHSTTSSDPIYVSEIMERSMNPSFAFFDLDALGPNISRSDACLLRVWAKRSEGTDWAVLLEISLNLRSMQFIGKTLDAFHHPLPENCVLLHLSDGIYTSFTDMPAGSKMFPYEKDTKGERTQTGSSFDSLMQLANLDECIQDALKERKRLEEDVDELLRQQNPARDRDQAILSQRDRVSTARAAVEAVNKQNAHLQRRIDELRRNLKARRDAVKFAAQSPDANAPGRRGLMVVFPIEAIKNKALQFTIRSIHLPNSTFDDTNRDEIAAAFGFTTQLVQHLSLYLRCGLPYPLEVNSSQSWIEDPISAGLTQRRYPLHPTSVAYKFEYGVFLLNKNIEILMSKAGLRVLDIRHTLPNLKYLLYVLTAGSGDLPARKAGGIRGLLGGKATPTISRRTSEDSVQGSHELLKHVQANGGAVAKEKPAELYSASPPSRLVYRHSNLREA